MKELFLKIGICFKKEKGALIALSNGPQSFHGYIFSRD
jgi:hypothetical protein